MIELDFEARSACNIKKAGTQRYALDPTTEIMCLAWSVDGAEPELWHPAYPNAGLPEHNAAGLRRLHARIAFGDDLIEAHNAMMEWAIWTHIGQARLGWPELPVDRLRCSAAKAAAYGLPRALDRALKALGSDVQKDAEGHRLMMKLSKPRKPLKAELVRAGCKTAAEFAERYGLLWHEKPEELQRLFAYCRQDVRAEQALSKLVPDLIPEELALWQLDQRMNRRGVAVDVEGVKVAIDVAARESRRFDAEMDALTFGAVPNCRQTAVILKWINARGGDVPDLQAATIDLALQRKNLPDMARRALVLRRESAKASVKKLNAVVARACPDGRMRDLFVFCGAAHTGRWAGAGFQAQNLVRGGSVEQLEGEREERRCAAEGVKDEKTIKKRVAAAKMNAQETAWRELVALGPGRWIVEYPQALTRLAHMLRGVIKASPGCRLIAADFASIESCVLAWEAGEERMLRILSSGGSLYKDMCGAIYSIPDPQKNVSKGTPEYQVSKNAVLGLGFGMGGPKFVVTCAKVGTVISEEFSKEVVQTYRSTYPRVKALWYSTEAAACEAVRSPGRITEAGRVHFRMKGRALRMKLPSGRCLTYMDPKLKPKKTPWGEDRDSLEYMGVDSKTGQWRRLHTYGGALVENSTQAIARDLLRDAMLRLDAAGYPLVMSAHDESTGDVPNTFGSERDFGEIMCQLPAWAVGCPVSQESWSGPRYRK